MADVFDLSIFHDLRESQLTRTHETHLWVQEREQEEGGQSRGQAMSKHGTQHSVTIRSNVMTSISRVEK